MLSRLPEKLQMSTFRSQEKRAVLALLSGRSGGFTPKGHLAMSRDFLIVMIGGCYWWLEARDDAQHPTIPRAFSLNIII